MIRVAIANQQRFVRLDRPRLRRIVREVITGEGITDAEISLAFVDDRTIHRINKRFLDHDEPTDVISFPLSAPKARILSGELIVSAETAKRIATQLGGAAESELTLYVVHGLLHLCGYDDCSAPKRRAMRKRERHYLARI